MELSKETTAPPAEGSGEGSANASGRFPRISVLFSRAWAGLGRRSKSPASAIASARSPLVSLLLSLAWPGLGHLYLGRRLAAAVFGVPMVVLAAWAIVELSQGSWGLALDLLNEPFALGLTVVILLAGLWRGVAMVHSLILARPIRESRTRYAAVLAVLLVIMSAIHVRAAAYPWSFYNFDRAIYVANEEPPPSWSAEPTSSPTRRPTPYMSGGIASATPTLSPLHTPRGTPPPNAQRITFLVTGVDYMKGRAHYSMDTLMVVSFDTKNKTVAIVSVPRDTANFPYYWGGQAGPRVKINTFWSRVKSGQIKAPDSPWDALKNEIGFLVGVHIDYYASVDIDGFPGLVDIVGGVDVINPRPINDPFSNTILPAGPLHLDGVTALHYVRSREGGGNDYWRSGRQQDVIVALERKVTSPEGLLKLPELLDAAGRVVKTDFPLAYAKRYLNPVKGVPDKNISMCVLGPPYNYAPDRRTTGGTYTSRLKLDLVASLSVYLLGPDSSYFGQEFVVPMPCLSKY